MRCVLTFLGVASFLELVFVERAHLAALPAASLAAALIIIRMPIREAEPDVPMSLAATIVLGLVVA